MAHMTNVVGKAFGKFIKWIFLPLTHKGNLPVKHHTGILSVLLS